MTDATNQLTFLSVIGTHPSTFALTHLFPFNLFPLSLFSPSLSRSLSLCLPLPSFPWHAHLALVDVGLTQLVGEARQTDALEAGDFVHAGGAVQTRVRRALVDVLLAILP